MSVQAKLLGIETIKFYALADAPIIPATDPRSLMIQPERLRIRVENGAVVMVSVAGPVQRRDSKPGTRRLAVWTAAEGWRYMPDWVADIVKSTGAVLRGGAS